MRIRVVGNSGSGKSTLARELAGRLGLAHQELDHIFWGPRWTMREQDAALAHLRDWCRTAGKAGWVVDGNWNDALAGALDNASMVVWLDYSRWVVMSRIIRRTLWRQVSRKQVCGENREMLRNLFSSDPDKNIIAWSWTQHQAYRDRYLQMAAGDPRVVRLTSPRQTRAFLVALTAGMEGSER